MNLLTNPGFNAGYHHQDDVSELTVPDGWQLYYVDNDTFPGCGTPPAYRPESVVWNIEDAPKHEKKLFFLDGNYCLKVFKAQGRGDLIDDVKRRFTGERAVVFQLALERVAEHLFEAYRVRLD